LAHRIFRCRRHAGEELHGHLAQVSPLFWATKYAMDLTVSLALLPILLVCMVFLLVCNPFWNPGPMIFSQDRMGRDGRIFRMFKFRTMTGIWQGHMFEKDDIVRVSRLGAFMRRTRIDELPQILNVLLGQMSVIGPRPEQPEFTRQYIDHIPGFELRLSVKPGISGLAQVKLGYTDTIAGAAHKLRWDLIYMSRLGVGTECYIIARTAALVFRRLARTITTRIPLGRNAR